MDYTPPDILANAMIRHTRSPGSLRADALEASWLRIEFARRPHRRACDRTHRPMSVMLGRARMCCVPGDDLEMVILSRTSLESGGHSS